MYKKENHHKTDMLRINWKLIKHRQQNKKFSFVQLLMNFESSSMVTLSS